MTERPWMVTEHRKPEHPAEIPLEVTDGRTVAIVYGGAQVVKQGWPYWREIGPLPSV